MTLVPAFDIPRLCIPKSIDVIPQNILDHATSWAKFVPPGSGNMNLVAMKVTATGEARQLLEEIQQKTHEWKMELYKEKEADWKISLVSRAFESICRFALIYACSETLDPINTVITIDAVTWAKKLIFWDIENKFAMVAKYHYESEFERNSERVVQILKRWKTKHGVETPMPGWILNRSTKFLDQREFDSIIQRLQGQERIKVEVIPTGGRPAKYYSLI
jgi:hypothetical protein